MYEKDVHVFKVLSTYDRYPHLFYPEMYLMKGGYKEFFNKDSGAYQVNTTSHLDCVWLLIDKSMSDRIYANQ